MKNKTILAAILLMAAMQFYPGKAYCQRRLMYLPGNGYWVLVSNKGSSNETTVQFYNDNNRMISGEKVFNVRFRLNRVRTLRWLKSGLDKALVAYDPRA